MDNFLARAGDSQTTQRYRDEIENSVQPDEVKGEVDTESENSDIIDEVRSIHSDQDSSDQHIVAESGSNGLLGSDLRETEAEVMFHIY